MRIIYSPASEMHCLMLIRVYVLRYCVAYISRQPTRTGSSFKCDLCSTHYYSAKRMGKLDWMKKMIECEWWKKQVACIKCVCSNLNGL